MGRERGCGWNPRPYWQGSKRKPSGGVGGPDGWTRERRFGAGFFVRVGNVVRCEAIGKGFCPMERRERSIAKREREVAERERLVAERERAVAECERGVGR